MEIKWLTIEEIEVEAEKGHNEALLCSIKHWEQIKAAGAKLYWESSQFGVVLVTIGASFCALCRRYQEYSCKGCPLIVYGNTSCCKEYHDAVAKMDASDAPLGPEWDIETADAIDAMIDRLKSHIYQDDTLKK